MIITVTERGDFRRCRRMWDLTSLNRRALTRAGISEPQFLVGSVVHAALAAQAVAEDWRAAIAEYVDEQEREYARHYVSVVGTGWGPEEQALFKQHVAFGTQLAANYFDHYGDNPVAPWKYVATEVSFRLRIAGTRDGYLGGTFDGLAVDQTGGIWIVEHKTFSETTSDRFLTTDDQMHTYVWAARQLFKEPVRGVLYDGILKKLPVAPRKLQNGKLSRERIATTRAMYLATIEAEGQDPAEYADVLDRLEKEPTNFYRRYQISFPETSFPVLAANISAEYKDMACKTTPMYPNYTWAGCWDCRVPELCTAMQFGEDVELLIAQGWVKSGGHRTVKAQSRPLQRVTSVYDLKRG